MSDQWFAILAVWLLCSAICLAIAKAKGYPEGEAVASGLLLGIFAVIYYLVVPTKRLN